MRGIKKLIAWLLIPRGLFCEDCPFLSKDHRKQEQGNGYCSYLGKGDWDLNTECAEEDVEVTTRQPDGTYSMKVMKYKDLPPNSLLWDGCKECQVRE